MSLWVVPRDSACCAQAAPDGTSMFTRQNTDRHASGALTAMLNIQAGSLRYGSEILRIARDHRPRTERPRTHENFL